MGVAVTGFLGPEADNTKDGACTNCGKCCADTLPLTPLDISRIKTYVKKHAIKPIDHELNPHWNPPRDDVCPFFIPFEMSGRHCRIYEVRPIICKHYLCRGYADPMLHIMTQRAIMEEAKQQPAVKKDLALFLTPRSMRYSIWPEKFPEYRHTQLIFQP